MTTAMRFVPKCWCLARASPEQGSPGRVQGTLCCAVPGSGTHPGISTAQCLGSLDRWAWPSPALQPQDSVLWMCCFGFGRRGNLQETATVLILPGRRKAFLLGWSSCLGKLSVHLCLPGMWDPVSLKPSLGEGLRVPSCPS